MKKTASIIVGLVLVAGAGAAFGQDCGPLNLQFLEPSVDLFPGDPLYDEYVPMIAAHFGLDPAVFQWCWTQRVVGTIPGTWVSCGGDPIADYDLFGLPSDPHLYLNPGIIITRRGDVYTISYGLSRYDADFNWIAFGGVTYYEGATGKWAGAEGWGTDRPKHYPPSFWIRSFGSLCMPD
jgi:hypothetical protein